MYILETERVYLREFNVEDAKHFYLLNLDEEVIKYTGDEPFKSIDEAKVFLQNYNHYQKYGYGRWAVIRKSDTVFLGWCGLKYTVDKEEIDIGFRFFKKYWNKGYATESSKACIQYGFEKLKINKIVGRAMKNNIASTKVLEKIGLRYSSNFDFDGNKGVIYKIESDKK